MKKLFSILLCLMFLGGTLGYSLATHYCGGKIVNQGFSLSGETVGCGMEDATDSCPDDQKQLKRPCCQNQVLSFKISDDYAPAYYTVDLTCPATLVDIMTTAIVVPAELTLQYTAQHYKPPLPERDYPVIFQSFLI